MRKVLILYPLFYWIILRFVPSRSGFIFLCNIVRDIQSNYITDNAGIFPNNRMLREKKKRNAPIVIVSITVKCGTS